MTSRFEISGPAIGYWPELREALEARHLTHAQVRYIEAVMSEEWVTDPLSPPLTNKVRKVVHATIVLHTSERLPIGEVRMIYDGGTKDGE